MQLWLWMALASGGLLGVYEIFKKKALGKSPLLSVLTLYSFFCFAIVSFEFSNALQVEQHKLVLIFIKALVIFFAWLLGFTAIANMPISIITPFSTASPLFTIILGVMILNERLGYFQIAGVIVILVSYYLIGKTSKSEVKGLFKNKYFYLMIGSALLSAVSALIDKVALKTINTGQMQFWFYLFVTLLFFVALLFNKRGKVKQLFKFNYFILLASILLVVSDRIYFDAVNIPLSQISIIMPLRKVSVFVSAIVGGIIFKEKNIKAKFTSICLLILGIVILFLGK